MKKLVIVGNSSYSRMMKKYIDLTDYGKVEAYAVDTEYIQVEKIDELPVISFEELRENYSCDEFFLIMGIGYTQMSEVRKRIFEQCKSWGYRFENFIHPTAIISEDVVLGEGNNILEGVILEAGVIAGNANLFFGGSMIGHESAVGDYNTFAGKSMLAGCVTVKDNCFFGVSSAVKDHVTIEDYVLLGALAYGFQDMKAYSVVVPAKSVVLEGRKSTEFL